MFNIFEVKLLRVVLGEEQASLSCSVLDVAIYLYWILESYQEKYS